MERIPEPELMDDPEQALAYAQADFSATHGARVEMFRSLMPSHGVSGPVLDLGCGAGDVLFRFARAYLDAHFVGVDGSRPMLALAQSAIDADPALRDRVRVRYGIIPECQLPQEPWRLIMSHSLLHQLHRPQVLWQTLAECAESADRGCAVFVADLRRPASELEARRMVQSMSKDEPEILQRDFFNSLCAAFTPGEVRAQLAAAGLTQLRVDTHEPFHLSISGLL
jgi:SAM-dependent methyltransferase